jgi:hypothetical protein
LFNSPALHNSDWADLNMPRPIDRDVRILYASIRLWHERKLLLKHRCLSQTCGIVLSQSNTEMFTR